MVFFTYTLFCSLFVSNTSSSLASSRVANSVFDSTRRIPLRVRPRGGSSSSSFQRRHFCRYDSGVITPSVSCRVALREISAHAGASNSSSNAPSSPTLTTHPRPRRVRLSFASRYVRTLLECPFAR